MIRLRKVGAMVPVCCQRSIRFSSAICLSKVALLANAFSMADLAVAIWLSYSTRLASWAFNSATMAGKPPKSFIFCSNSSKSLAAATLDAVASSTNLATSSFFAAASALAFSALLRESCMSFSSFSAVVAPATAASFSLVALALYSSALAAWIRSAVSTGRTML